MLSPRETPIHLISGAERDQMAAVRPFLMVFLVPRWMGLEKSPAERGIRLKLLLATGLAGRRPHSLLLPRTATALRASSPAPMASDLAFACVCRYVLSPFSESITLSSFLPQSTFSSSHRLGYPLMYVPPSFWFDRVHFAVPFRSDPWHRYGQNVPE